MSSTLFPRGGFQEKRKAEEGSSSSEKKKKAPKKGKSDEVLFGHARKDWQKELGSEKKRKAVSARSKKVDESADALAVVTKAVVSTKAKKSTCRGMTFSNYGEETSVLGAVRSVTSRHAVVSVPGGLAGHAEVGTQLRVRVGDMLACAVLSRRRLAGKAGKQGAKRIELSPDPRSTNKQLRLDDLDARVRTVYGRVASDEKRGYVVDIGVAGATGFVKKSTCPEQLEPGDLRHFKVVVRRENGVVDLGLARVAAGKCRQDDPDYSWASIIPGQLVDCTVARRFPDGGALVRFGHFAGVVDPDHWPSDDMSDGADADVKKKNKAVSFAGEDDDTRAKDEVPPPTTSVIQARVIAVDRAQKVIRLSRLPHVLGLRRCGPGAGFEAALPEIGTFMEDLQLERFDPKVGAWFRGAFAPAAKLPDDVKAAILSAGYGADASSSRGERKKTSFSLPKARVVGGLLLEARALISATPDALDAAKPSTKDEIRPGDVFEKVAVTKTAEWGLELRLSETVTATATNAHVSDAALLKVDPRKRFKPGRLVDCRVLRVEPRRVTVTLKTKLVRDPFKPLDSFAVAARFCGASFLGLVTGFDSTSGLAVTFYGDVHGRIPPSSLVNRGIRVRDLGPGDILACAVRRCVQRTELASGKPRLVLCLAPEVSSSFSSSALSDAVASTTVRESDVGLAELQTGAVFESAVVLELVKRKKVVEGALVAVERISVRTHCNLGRPWVARLNLADATDDGRKSAAWLAERFADKASFPVVVLDPPARGALARVSAARLAVARPDLLPRTSTPLVHSEFVGVVVAVRKAGVVLASSAGFSAWVPKARLADAFVDDATRCDHLAVGDATRFAVVAVGKDGQDDQSSKVVARTSSLKPDASLAVLYATSPWLCSSSSYRVGVAFDAVVREVGPFGARCAVSVRAEKKKKNLKGVPSEATRLIVPPAEVLDCAPGDTVKLRILYPNGDSGEVACTMRPELVRAGRKKRRSELEQTLEPKAKLVGSTLTTLADRLALVVLADTKAIGIVPLAGYATRGLVERRKAQVVAASVFEVRNATVSEARSSLDPAVATLESPFDDLPVLGLPGDDDQEVGSSDNFQSSSGGGGVRPGGLRPAPSELKEGARVDCRVQEVGQASLQLSVRPFDSTTTTVTATMDISDVLVDRLVRDRDDPAHAQPAFTGVQVGTVVADCVVLKVDRSETLRDGRTRITLSVGVVSGDDKTLRARPSSWSEIGRRVDAVVLGGATGELKLEDSETSVLVAVAPGVRGRVDVLDAVNSVADAENEAFSSNDVDAVVAQTLAETLAPGARLQVSVKDADSKRLTPWLDDDTGAARVPKKGDVVVAKRRPAPSVTHLDRFVDLPGGYRGRVCATECDDPADRVDFQPADGFANVGEDGKKAPAYVKVVVLEDTAYVKGTFECSTRPSRLRASSAGDPSACDPDPRPTIGRVVPGFVAGVDPKAGVFVKLARDLTGRVLKKDASDGYVEDLKKEFFVGRLVAPVVLSTPTGGRVDLSLRASDIRKEGRPTIEVEPGAKLTGRVTRVEDFGVFVKLDDAPRHAASGLCHISEIADERVTDIRRRFHKNDKVKALVLAVDPKDPSKHRVSLSLKPAHFADDAQSSDDDDDDQGDDDDDDQGDDDVEARVDALLENDDDDDALLSGDDELLGEDELEEEEEEEDEDDEDDDDDEELPSRTGLQWEDDDDDAEEEDDEEEEDEEPVAKRARSEREADEEARERETELAEGAAPRSHEDFERLVRSEPNSGSAWARYMAYRVAETDAVGGRAVAARALEIIDFRRRDERLAVWQALMRLEHEHGGPAALTAVVDRACAANDPENILLYLAELHGRAGEHDLAEAAFVKAQHKAKGRLSLDAWAKHARARLAAGDADGGRAVLDRALQAKANDPKAKIALLARFAVAEFDLGSPERAVTIFDDLTATLAAKRLDVWQLYIAKILKLKRVAAARAVYARLADAPLPPKAMQTALRRFVEFEKVHGDAAAVARVRQLARNYVDARKLKLASSSS